MNLNRIKKAIAGLIATFLVTKIGLDSHLAESVGWALVVALSVYVPSNS